MDKNDFTLIKNETKIKQERSVATSNQTNPIMKKFVKFHTEKNNFSVKDLFKGVRN